MSDKLFDTIFNLKFTAKQLQRQAASIEKDVKGLRKKAYKAKQDGNKDAARSYLNNSLNMKKTASGYLTQGMSLETMAMNLELQAKAMSVSRDMEKTVGVLNRMLKATPVEKIHLNMKEMQKCFENLQINTSTMTDTMANQGPALTATEEEIDQEMEALDAEFSLDLKNQLQGANQAMPVVQQEKVQDDLTSRLAALQRK